MPTPPVPPRVQGPLDRRGARAKGITDWHLRHRDVLHASRDTYLPRSGDELQRMRAVLLGAPDGAVVSHLTAARLWGFQVPLVAEDERVHLTVPRDARLRQRRDRRLHFSDVPAPETRRLHGVVTTSPSRTWMDLAAVVPPAALLAVADQMLARGYPRAQFPAVLLRSAGRRGIVTARRVAACADPSAGSPMESVLRWAIHEAGLPPPVLQHVVRDGGRFLGQVDLAWPDRRVVVEFDGDVHRDRRVFVADVRRQNGLVLAGWTILRFTSADLLGRPHQVLAAIRAALGLG
ncbi:endonuclease domain-containing protein [Blastococcus sp. SYSU DS0541]